MKIRDWERSSKGEVCSSVKSSSLPNSPTYQAAMGNVEGLVDFSLLNCQAVAIASGYYPCFLVLFGYQCKLGHNRLLTVYV